jgi:hypothetical protein
VHEPTCIFWANLALFSLQAKGARSAWHRAYQRWFRTAAPYSDRADWRQLLRARWEHAAVGPSLEAGPIERQPNPQVAPAVARRDALATFTYHREHEAAEFPGLFESACQIVLQRPARLLPALEEGSGRRVAYFEVLFRGGGSIGLSAYNRPGRCHLGWCQNSYGYHNDDGERYWNVTPGTAADNQHMDYSHRPYGPPFGADVETGEPVIGGDVVGCGLDFDCCSIFFTVNGTELPTAFVDVDVTREWFPSFSLLLPGDEAEIVSGHPSAPFSWRWDAEAILGLKWHVTCATELKETGNQNFRGGNFKTAVGFYTLGLAHPELNELAGVVEVVLLSNRAEAYLKLEGWQLAIADCKAALTLDPTHAKSQRRLASAQTFALLAEERK